LLVTAEQGKPGGNAAGRARREQILERASEFFAANGFGATSMREIAAACGLTPAGLSHHFPDKATLLLALIQQREQQQLTEFAGMHWTEWARSVERQNRANRSLTQLFAMLSAEAIETDHPAHEYFVRRYRVLRERFALFVCEQRGGGEVDDADRTSAQVLIAMWDGLQLQGMLDPDVDMEAAFDAAIDFVQRNAGIN
jgi:AcrR family transcriptional regulator